MSRTHDPAWRARMDTVAGRKAVLQEWADQGDIDGTFLWNMAYRYPCEDRQRGRVDFGIPQHPGWGSYLNAAAVRELTQGEGSGLRPCPFGTPDCWHDPDYARHRAAVEAAQAGLCSHGGHGWDGDTCSDIPPLPEGR